MIRLSNSVQARRLIGVCALVGTLLACSDDAPVPTPSGPSAAAATEGHSAVDDLVVDPIGHRTTSAAIAFGNLDASISAAEARLAAAPADLPRSERLVALLLTRTTYRGTFDDFDRALDVATRAADAAPEEPAAQRLLASAFSATHRFDDAGSALGLAEALGADVSAERLLLAVALGRPFTIPEPSDDGFQHLVRRAATLAAAGRFDEADASFVGAARTLRDPSPLLPAWIAFQRGVMWAETADRSDRGRRLYQEALRRLPGYVVATVHLAELDAEAGDRALALERLESVVGTTRDPEPAGLLAELLASTNPSRAAMLRNEARERYDALLERHPEAFADHGSEFFATVDPVRSLDLALANLDVRQNDRAFLVALEAADAVHSRAAHCDILARLERRPVAVTVRALAAQVAAASRCP